MIVNYIYIYFYQLHKECECLLYITFGLVKFCLYCEPKRCVFINEQKQKKREWTESGGRWRGSTIPTLCLLDPERQTGDKEISSSTAFFIFIFIFNTSFF